MRTISFKNKIWLFVTIFSTTVLTIAFAILAVGYYFFSLNSFKKQLIASTQEIFQNHLVFDNNQIFFKRDVNNMTISAYLRDRNMSAIFFDKNMDSFAEYGVYQKMVDENKPINIDNLDIPKFEDLHFYPNEEYFTLTTPILFDNNKVGLVQIALFTPFFSQVKSVGLYLLLIIIIFCVLVSWPLSHILVSYFLKPLEDLVKSMETARLTKINVPIENNKHSKDEIGILVESYNKMISRIAEGFERQKAFISQASHELKAPLARSVSSLDVILLDKKDDEIMSVRDDLKSFAGLIDELLLLSKVDSGTMKLNMTKIDLCKIIGEIIDIYRRNIEAKNIEVKIECNIGLQVMADYNLLKLIISNLLSNAIKYSRNNGNISISAEIVNSEISLKIADFGIGISQNDLLKIFDRFFRSPEVSKTQGFGIGLALVKQVCNLHKLNINFESKFGVGTTVIISGLKVAN